jgi:hypothetical protein
MGYIVRFDHAIGERNWIQTSQSLLIECNYYLCNHRSKRSAENIHRWEKLPGEVRHGQDSIISNITRKLEITRKCLETNAVFIVQNIIFAKIET